MTDSRKEIATHLRALLAPLQRHPTFSAKTLRIEAPQVTEDTIATFLDALAAVLSEAAHAGPVTTRNQINGVAGSSADWERIQFPWFPVLIETLRVVPDTQFQPDTSFPFARWESPGVLCVPASTLSVNPTKHSNDWLEFLDPYGANSGGLTASILTVPPAASAKGAELRPLVLHALRPDGAAVDRGDPAAQKAVCNAFWQTFWATGARRSERGVVFPVAFYPVDRTCPIEFAGPFHSRYVSLRRRLFGRSAILAYAIELITKSHALLFDADACRFFLRAGFIAEKVGLPAADAALALHELNRTAFPDCWTGANAEQFAQWKQLEESRSEGAPWDAALVAGELGPDAFADASRPGVVEIRRVVPYTGSAYLSEVVSQTAELRRRGKIQNLPGEILAATNSGFFLNFPEEYSTIHSAMNEPVGLLVENSQVHQIKTLRRAAYIVGTDSSARISTDAGISLHADPLIFEGESSSATYATHAHASFDANLFGPLFFGAAVVGNSIVETFEETKTEVPPNGWLIGDSEAFGGEIDPANAAGVEFRDGNTRQIPVRHALAAGPLLLRDGVVIPFGESREEFLPLIADSSPSADETAQLTRTQLPDAFRTCLQRGVPPTRFPHDWNETRAPRTALGIRPDGSVILVVVDGRSDTVHSVGVTLAELAAVMQGIGARDAMNLDGGGSSVMFLHDPAAAPFKLRDYLPDGVVTLPSDPGGIERLLPVPLILCTSAK